MIQGYEKIKERIGQFHWFCSKDDRKASYAETLAFFLDQMQKVIAELYNKRNVTHLCFSGGVDSTILLWEMVKHGPVVAHVMAGNAEHPDWQYASYAASCCPGVVLLRPHFVKKRSVDCYYQMMENIENETNKIICGVCADSFFGGNYSHLQAVNLSETMHKAIVDLVPKDLKHLDAASTKSEIIVHLPFASKEIMNAASRFTVNECVVPPNLRKRPIMDMAGIMDVPEFIIKRRKIGLIDWHKST